ncbi:CCA tRNA nucleotidyltransferase [Arsenicitalea aurantiaca]|uniref:CCA tRNA nucleotidyltransferase n=1 Tax=Arsenicitalea aurantiaca TaxID=1783274 RepID=A0A433XLJ2_9HYPH|nr:CCA tRNA nucleotidyltransferase [Arsenicitalea aurantiaca]RUT34949.1 CCA tRNA nucleotidyltransferase [Arsenicitalea aurantiaca]
MREPDPRLAGASWLTAPEARAVFTLLDGEEGRTRAVGGVVRDTLIGRARTQPDVDLATELLPDEVVGRAEAAGIAAFPTGIAHGTVTLKSGNFLAEVTTLREDVETDGRHAVVRFGTDWVRDAERRDFTMNALYADAAGRLYDPLGGLEDLAAGRVRFVGDADRRIAEDRLRVYRFFRFAAGYGTPFGVENEGFSAVARAAGTLGGLSAERVGAEMKRLLTLPRIGWVLRLMESIGIIALGAERLACAEAYEEGNPAPTLAGRLAIFLDAMGEGGLRRAWRLSNAELLEAGQVLETIDLLARGAVDEARYRFPQAIGDAVRLLCLRPGADAGAINQQVFERKGISVPRFPVSGGDMVRIGVSPGPEMGRILRKLEQKWIESGFTLERETLIKFAVKLHEI